MGNQTTSLTIPPAVNITITYWNDSGAIDYDKVFSNIQSNTGIDPLRLCVEKKEGFCKRSFPNDGTVKPVVIVTIKPESGSVWEKPYAQDIEDIVNKLWSEMYGVAECCIELDVM